MLYNKLQEHYDSIPNHDILIVVEYFNVQIRREECFGKMAGEHGLHEKTSDNSTKLCNTAAIPYIIITSSKFKHGLEHKIPLKISETTKGNQIERRRK